MVSVTSIEWTDRTWNPTRGCSRVSEGCRNCYAERMAARFAGGGPRSVGGPKKPFYHFAKMTEAGPRWTGEVALMPEKLDEPRRWRKPQRVFVNSMSDLFHEALSLSDIAEVFWVMGQADRHTFQVLTKRPRRMLEIIGDGGWMKPWPHANVWLGVSVEDQKTADERIPLLLQTPAAVRFVSYEPALGPVCFDDSRDWLTRNRVARPDGAVLDWIIVGGESGPGARPFDVAWARETIRQCREAGVAVFVKQMGRWLLGDDAGFQANHYLLPDGRGFVPPMIGERAFKRPDEAIGFSLLDPKGGDMQAWPENLRVREFPR